MPPRNKPTASAPVTVVKVVYPRVSFTVCADPMRSGVTPELAAQIKDALRPLGCEDLLNYVPPMTYLDAVTYLGASWEQEGEDFGTDFLFLDRYGKKVRCGKNVRNRPLKLASVESRCADILNHRWQFNGETGIIGDDDNVLNFQNTCVALIYAFQDWKRVVDAVSGVRRWLSRWPEEQYPDGPVIEKCVVSGIKNVDAVVNTIDTGVSRTLSDVLYRCPYFEKLPVRDPKTNVDRATAAKATATAIQRVWNRTGMYISNFGSVMTHSEAVTWIENHGGVRCKLLEAVKTVLNLNQDGRITRYVTLGYAAAMLYLMGQWETEENRVGLYFKDDPRSGKRLQWGGWDRAMLFWSEFGRREVVEDGASGSKEGKPMGPLAALTKVLGEELVTQEESHEPRGKQIDYAVVSAWRAFRALKNPAKQIVERDDCKVKYREEKGYQVLKWTPEEKCVGGIDLGNEKIVPNPEDGISPDPETEGKVENGKQTVASEVTDEMRTPKPDAPIETAAQTAIETLLSTIHKDHPAVGPVFWKTRTGYSVFGDVECGLVGSHCEKTPRMHPKGVKFLSFTAEESEVMSEKLTDAGITVGFVTENVGATNGDPRYTMDRLCGPVNKVRGAGRKS